MADAKRFVGIDGASAQLGVAIWPNGESLSVANDETGISELARRLETADLVIIETTGGLEVPCQCPGDGGDRGCSGQPGETSLEGSGIIGVLDELLNDRGAERNESLAICLTKVRMAWATSNSCPLDGRRGFDGIGSSRTQKFATPSSRLCSAGQPGSGTFSRSESSLLF